MSPPIDDDARQVPDDDDYRLREVDDDSDGGSEDDGDIEDDGSDDRDIDDQGSDYPEEYDDDIRLLADSLITANGEAIADVLAGIRDALEKMNKVLYATLK